MARRIQMVRAALYTLLAIVSGSSSATTFNPALQDWWAGAGVGYLQTEFRDGYTEAYFVPTLKGQFSQYVTSTGSLVASLSAGLGGIAAGESERTIGTNYYKLGLDLSYMEHLPFRILPGLRISVGPNARLDIAHYSTRHTERWGRLRDELEPVTGLQPALGVANRWEYRYDYARYLTFDTDYMWVDGEGSSGFTLGISWRL